MNPTPVKTRSKKVSGTIKTWWQVTKEPLRRGAEKRQADDLFGSEPLWIPAGGRQRGREEEEKKEKSEVKRGYSRSRASLNDGELDCANTSEDPS